MADVQALKTEMIAVVKKLKTANSFSVSIPDANVFSALTPKNQSQLEPRYFPKAFVLVDEGSNKPMVSRRYDRKVTFAVILVFKPTPPETRSAEDIAVDALDALDDLFVQNSTLNGLANSALLASWTIDAGAAKPEGIVCALVDVTYMVQY